MGRKAREGLYVFLWQGERVKIREKKGKEKEKRNREV